MTNTGNLKDQFDASARTEIDHTFYTDAPKQEGKLGKKLRKPLKILSKFRKLLKKLTEKPAFFGVCYRLEAYVLGAATACARGCNHMLDRIDHSYGAALVRRPRAQRTIRTAARSKCPGSQQHTTTHRSRAPPTPHPLPWAPLCAREEGPRHLDAIERGCGVERACARSPISLSLTIQAPYMTPRLSNTLDVLEVVCTSVFTLEATH